MHIAQQKSLACIISIPARYLSWVLIIIGRERLAFVVLLGLSGLSLFTTACQQKVPPYSPVFVPVECAMELPGDYDVRCGTVTVPEDRQKNSERAVVIAVAVVAASGSTSSLPPVIFLDGGPGGATLVDLPQRVAILKKVIADRPVVFFDQRGVGLSQPALDCPEYKEAQIENIEQALSREEENKNISQALSACKQRLEASGVSLAAYTTAASADDVRDIITALGYPQVYLHGVSYGTRLAQVIMLRHQSEGWIAGAILDSVVPLQVAEVQEFWLNTQAIFKDLFARCAAEQACSRRYPDLQATFYTTFEQLEAKPLDVNVFHPATGKNMTIKLSSHKFVSLLFLLLYDPYQTTKIPQIIDQVKQGDPRALKEPLQMAVAVAEFTYIGMQQSVNCTDEGMNLDLQAIQATHAELDPVFQKLADGMAEQQQTDCQLWGVKPAKPDENQALQTDLPILILSGSQDPITPAAWGELLHASMLTAYYYEFPRAAHGVLGTIGSVNICAEAIMLAFLEDHTKPPQAPCIQGLKPMKFAVPSN